MVSAEKLLQNFQPKVCLFRSHPSLSSFFKIITRPFGSLVSFFFLMNILQWLRLAVFMIKALPVEIPEKMRHRRYIFMFLFLFQNLKSSIRLIFLPAHEAYNAADGYVALFSTEEGIANEGKSRWAQPSLCHVSITHHSPSIIAYANTIVFNLPVNFPSAANTSLLHTLLSNNFVFSRLRLCQDIGNPERSKFYLAVRIYTPAPLSSSSRTRSASGTAGIKGQNFVGISCNNCSRQNYVPWTKVVSCRFSDTFWHSGFVFSYKYT